jgi:AhpD family alkylhydroperoxidase
MNTINAEFGTEVRPRLKNREAAPAVWQAMMALQEVVNQSGLEPELLELAKTRASQINRCAFCLDMHFRGAVANGEKAERLYLLDAWAEVDLYSDRERAALRWTEALTRLSDAPVSDETFAAVRAHFTEAELLELTLAIVAINGWNRFNVGFRVPPGAA